VRPTQNSDGKFIKHETAVSLPALFAADIYRAQTGPGKIKTGVKPDFSKLRPIDEPQIECGAGEVEMIQIPFYNLKYGLLPFTCSAGGTQRNLRRELLDFAHTHSDDVIPVLRLEPPTAWPSTYKSDEINYSGVFAVAGALQRNVALFGERLVESFVTQEALELESGDTEAASPPARQLEAPRQAVAPPASTAAATPPVQPATRSRGRKRASPPPPDNRTPTAKDDLNDEIPW
jgi:hypothetical protein